MKSSMMALALVSLFAVSTVVRGVESENTSGATDAKVMTQTHDGKAAGNKHGDATKGGRPSTQASTTTRP